jgi:enoyl-CoA hydratase/carnithine racemase
LLNRAREYIATLAKTSSPASIADTKRLVYSHLGLGYVAALREAEEAVWVAMDRPDAREGAQSFAERRAPRFRRLGEEAHD